MDEITGGLGLDKDSVAGSGAGQGQGIWWLGAAVVGPKASEETSKVNTESKENAVNAGSQNIK